MAFATERAHHITKEPKRSQRFRQWKLVLMRVVESQRHREKSQTNKAQVSVTSDIILETVGLMRAEIVVTVIEY